MTRGLATSDTLHARVQAFAAGAGGESFEQLALALARYQAESSPGFARLLHAQGGRLERLADIPPVPSEAFRLARVATYPAELDAVRFFTSGTTGAERGMHPMRRIDTYRELSLAFARRALLPQAPGRRPVVVALAPVPTQPPSSSLAQMLVWFMQSFDGEPLDAEEQSFEAAAQARWLLPDSGLDLEGLRRAARAAHTRNAPLLLLATAFSLVHLLETLGAERLSLPAGSVVMQTGGFKGRVREVAADELRERTSQVLGLTPDRIVGEYGMTELTSQLYEATLRESALGRERRGVAGHYREPPWLRVLPVDPVSLSCVPDGELGLASFVDLGNVDSAVRVVTQDLVRRSEHGIELLGRRPGAPPRGCSLAVEALLRG